MLPLPFQCPGCKVLIKDESGLAGKKVHCPRCQAIAVVPERAPVPGSPGQLQSIPVGTLEQARPLPPEARADVSPPPTEGAITQRPTRARGSEDSRAAGALRGLRAAPAKATPVGLVLALVGAGVLLLLAGMGAVIGWWYSSAAGPAPVASVSPVLAEKPAEALKEDPNPPVKVTFVNGVFEAPINPHPSEVQPPSMQITRRFQFEGKPDTFYWAQIKENLYVGLKVVDLPVVLADSGLRRSPHGKEFSFRTGRAGPCTVVLEWVRLEYAPCRLVLREMDGTIPLPSELRLFPGAVDLPRLERVKGPNSSDKYALGAAFAAENKGYWTAHSDGLLRFWELPAMVAKGSYKSGQRLFALAADRKGRVYGQLTEAGREPFVIPRTIGDLGVWDDLMPEGDKNELPPPSKTIPLQGIVKRLLQSADGRWLYYLDVHNRILGRIDTATATVDKQIDNLSPGAASYCLTPDGKKIYCCSESNRIDVIDTLQFKLDKTIRLDRGKPTDIAASNEGLVFLIGEHFGLEVSKNSNCTCVDLTKGLPDQANVIPLAVEGHCFATVMLPDQRAVLFTGKDKIFACSLTAQPAFYTNIVREQYRDDNNDTVSLFLNSEGRLLVCGKGVVLSVGR
jgi:hypothetical protein